MKIETDDWMPLADACKEGGFSQSTGYRLAKSLGVIEVVFGVRIIRRKDVETMKKNRKRLGNPNWIASYEEASAAAIRAVESRMRRVEAEGLTEAEVARNKKLVEAAKNR